MGTSDPGQPDATADISAEPDCQAAGSGPSAPPSPATDNTMRTQGEQVGAELSVMRAVALELAALDPDAARRVVEWAASRVAYDLAAVAASLDVVAAARVYQHAAGGQSYHWRSGRSSDLAACGQSNLDTATRSTPPRSLHCVVADEAAATADGTTTTAMLTSPPARPRSPRRLPDAAGTCRETPPGRIARAGRRRGVR